MQYTLKSILLQQPKGVCSLITLTPCCVAVAAITAVPLGTARCSDARAMAGAPRQRVMLLLFAAATATVHGAAPRRAPTASLVRRRPQRPPQHKLWLRGGARDDDDDDEDDDDEKEPGAVAALLGDLPPCLRAHVVGVAATTAIALSGVVDPNTALALDTPRTIGKLQLWRPITSACFLGPPSMGSATSLYLLVKYGRELETAVGTTPFAKFLILQTVMLALFGGALGVPFVGNALITAVIYACSRLEPFGNIQFQFGITLKYWMLPFGLMAVEMLQQQGSVAAVVPHILGVLCAHFHHFFAVVWPRIMLEENGGDAPGPRSKASPLAQTRAGRKLGSG